MKNEILPPNEYFALLRNDFSTFIEGSFYQLNPDTNFLPNWHIEVIASELERCLSGETKRLIICVPPRSLKSHCASIAFPAWLLGRKPSAQIICASYAQGLADKLALDCRSLMNSDWYRQVFATRLSSQRQAVSEFMTEAQGFRMATSVGGVLTGRGGDFIIIDDPLKPDEAVSDTRRNAVNGWYAHTLYSRLNNKETGCIIVIMQRLHEDDLVGHVLQKDNWRVLRFPAIAIEDEQYDIQNCYGTRTVHRPAGQALHPERESLEMLNIIRRNLDEYSFSGQYQQDPAPQGGGIVKQEWFKTYIVGEEPGKFDLVLQSWDTAAKDKEENNYSVCTTWGKKDQNLYLVHVLRRRMDYPELKRSVTEQATRFKATTVLIEDKSSGTPLIQELRREGSHAIKAYQPKIDKKTRMHSVTSTIEGGFVHLPDKASWLADYLHEMITFPRGRYDDQCDSTSQALDWVKTASSYEGFERLLKHMAQTAASPKLGKEVEPCPSCGSRSISVDGCELECHDCGKIWNRPIRVTRADMLRGEF